MKIEIELKPSTARRIGVVAVTVGIVSAGAWVYAEQTKFASGQTLTAAALNGNFDELYAAAAKPTVSRNGKSISIGGTYCGVSAGPYDGATIGGYTGAKAKCETACTSPTAHMCDAAELTRSQQLGVTLPDGAWVAAFLTATNSGNCLSWTRGEKNDVGPIWTVTPALVTLVECDTTHAIACCD